MEQTITLTKQLEGPHEGPQYVENLAQLTDALSDTPFYQSIRSNLKLHTGNTYPIVSYKDEGYKGVYYNVDYGTNKRTNKSGVTVDDIVMKKDVTISNLRQLKKALKKATKTDEPKFELDYRAWGLVEGQNALGAKGYLWSMETQPNHADDKLVKKIIIHNPDSSTSLNAEINESGLATVEIRYDDESNFREKEKIDTTVLRLQWDKYKTEKPYEAMVPQQEFLLSQEFNQF